MARYALSFSDEERDVDDTLVHITQGAVRLIPGAQFAAVLIPMRPGRIDPQVILGDGLPDVVLNLQNAAGQGPCLEAIDTGRQISVGNVATESRWPQFSRPAGAAGIASISSTPMIVERHTIGVLTLISTVSDAFDDESNSLARIFGAHAAIALSGARLTANMTAALSSRDIIGQAKGILMERFKVTPDVAFTMLVKASSHTNVKLRTLCEDLSSTGHFPNPN
ncbi:GAF domain-containing protein [Nakamurella panacisegetis]|uniref:GAF domain-containing protein n=1 Tax=Nakamurella panacisegetis TaxID=1090615 RepID=A0A1H0REG3_9ACTN|nr:GAF domain-containing protein [Nakamurella panacisegetis]